MRVFKTKLFDGWAEEVDLSDKTLLSAIKEMEHGQFEANLGGYLYKKRIAIGNKGKSGGSRTIIAFREGDKAFFVYGFAKNKQDNINQSELLAYKEFAKLLFSFNDKKIKELIDNKKLVEII